MAGTAAYASVVPTGQAQPVGDINAFSIRFPNSLTAAQGWPAAASSQINYYEEFNHITTFTGPTVAGVAITFRVVRKNQRVSLYIPTVTVANAVNAIGTVTAALPVRFRPVTQVVAIAPVTDNSAVCQGAYQITTGGVITFGFTPGANAARQPLTITAFTNAGNSGTSHCVIEWSVA